MQPLYFCTQGLRVSVSKYMEVVHIAEDFARDNICPELLITEQEVKDQLEILNNSKPSGPDGVAPRILRSVSQCLVSPLTLLFNQSLQCGQLPYIWLLIIVL
jgi:hypothetical protein